MSDEKKNGLDDSGDSGDPGDMMIEFVEHDEGPHAVIPLGKDEGLLAAGKSRDEDASEKVKKLEDSLLRLRADFENYRRRAERDQAEAGDRAQGELIRSLLPVLDNLDTAIALLRREAPPQWSRGLELCQQSFMEVLAKAGAEPVEALNVQFNPELHEAVMLSRDPELPHGAITEVMQRGFLFKGKLIRAARVRVNRLDAEPQPETSNG